MSRYIKGSTVHYDAILQYFLSEGAKNPLGILCNNPDFTYYINTEGNLTVSTLRYFAEEWEEVEAFRELDVDQYIDLVVKFKDYQPSDPHITSHGDKIKVEEYFGIKSLNKLQLSSLRNIVVLVYTRWINSEVSTDKVIEHMRAMQSITTVIDHNIYEA